MTQRTYHNSGLDACSGTTQTSLQRSEVIRYIDYLIQTVENHINLTNDDRDRLVEDLQELQGHVENIEMRAANLAK